MSVLSLPITRNWKSIPRTVSRRIFFGCGRWSESRHRATLFRSRLGELIVSLDERVEFFRALFQVVRGLIVFFGEFVETLDGGVSVVRQFLDLFPRLTEFVVAHFHRFGPLRDVLFQ